MAGRVTWYRRGKKVSWDWAGVGCMFTLQLPSRLCEASPHRTPSSTCHAVLLGIICRLPWTWPAA